MHGEEEPEKQVFVMGIPQRKIINVCMWLTWRNIHGYGTFTWIHDYDSLMVLRFL